MNDSMTSPEPAFSICVYCGSRPGRSPAYAETARAVGQWIGRKIYRLRKRPNPGLIRETFWGLIILWIIGWLPYLGWMVKAIAIVVGLGASLVSCFGTRPCGNPPAVPLSPAVRAPRPSYKD